MSFERCVLVAGAVLVVAGCGGGSDNNNQSPRDPYVEFRVNGVLEPTSITRDWVEVNADDAGGFCDPDVFDNAQLIIDGGDSEGYCDRSVTNITFQFRYTNASYEDLDVRFSGLGYEVRVFEYDSVTGKGDEVWNSDYYVQRQILGSQEAGSDEEDFDPGSVTEVVLDASDSLPNSSNFYSVVFEGDRMFPASRPEYAEAFANGEQNDYFLRYPSAYDCDWTLQVNDTATAYRYVRCLGEEILPDPGTGTEPVQFLAEVKVSFSGEEQVYDPILITLNPPD